jgi:hypothetical protein
LLCLAALFQAAIPLGLILSLISPFLAVLERSGSGSRLRHFLFFVFSSLLYFFTPVPLYRGSTLAGQDEIALVVL